MGSISKDQLHALLEKEKGTTLIDVRDGESYRHAHVPGALHIPFHQLPEHLEKMDREKPVYFIGRYGIGYSIQAAEKAEGLGFQHAYFIEGGIAGWKRFGFPVVSSPDSQRHAGFNGIRSTALLPIEGAPGCIKE